MTRIRPILFSSLMVRAIIDGWKTQTRRVLKPQPDGKAEAERLPYAPGDFLWVRETFALESCQEIGWYDPPHADGRPLRVCEDTEWGRWWEQPHYRATDREPELAYGDGASGCRWKSSFFMPRWASRLTLRVTGVQMQRVRDINEEDAIAEGCRPFFDHAHPEMMGSYGDLPMAPLRGPLDDFRDRWNNLNKACGYGWDANPWIVAVTFEAIYANIDAVIASE